MADSYERWGIMGILGLPGELVALVLGWLFGLLSPGIADAIRRPKERSELVSALGAELEELRYTMALVADVMRSAVGTRDAQFLTWLEVTIASYTGTDPDQSKYLAGIRELLKQLPAKAEPAGLNTAKGLNLKTYELPFLASQVQKLSICSKAHQQQVLHIKAELDHFNSETVFLMRQFELTFSAISAENRQQVRNNLMEGYSKLGKMAIRVADLIGTLEGKRLS